MALEVDIKPNDEFEKAALRTADALKHISEHEEKIHKLSKKLGVSEQQVSKAVALAEKQEKDRAQKEAKAANVRLASDVKTIKGIELLKFVVKDVGGAALDAAKSVAEIGFELGKTAYEASQSRREAEAMIDAFTDHKGPQTLKVLDQLASNLGITFDETRSEFVKFRQAGMTNAMSATLIKTRADLIAVGLSAKSADEEISHVLGAGRNRAQAAHELAEIERAYKGVGFGAKAAAYNSTHFEGAMAKLQNIGTEKLADFWDKISPSIGKAANALASFIDSSTGQAAIDQLASSVQSIADSLTKENIAGALDDVTTAFNAVRSVADAVITVFDSVGTAIGWVASKIADELQFIEDLVTGNFGALKKDAIAFGGDLVEGLINGIEGAIGSAEEAIAGVASKVAKGFANALGIHSPSKVFQEFGENTVAGFQVGQESAMGGGDMPLQAAASKPPTAAPTSSGGPSIKIENLNVSASHGSPEEIARAIRQELQLLITAGQLSMGVT